MTTLNIPSVDSIKRQLQDHFKEGLTIIIGSGLSCAEGIPGMGELATYLSNEIPSRISDSDRILWEPIESQLTQYGLERALLNPISEKLEREILLLISSYLIEREQIVINEVLLGKRQLRLTRLLHHILFDRYLPIITTNYDRLVEVAVEEAGYGVDTFFTGKFIANLDPTKSQLSFCKRIRPPQRGHHPTLEYQKRAIICKPHGSLDWYFRDNQAIMFSWHIPCLDRLIVIPGQNKFKTGYNIPFDLHREKANFYIDKANRFLIIGYGFNDEHLETHLKKAISTGKQTVMLTHLLSQNALSLATNYENIIAVEHNSDNNVEGTRVIMHKKIYTFPNLNLWDLDNFITEVLEA